MIIENKIIIKNLKIKIKIKKILEEYNKIISEIKEYIKTKEGLDLDISNINKYSDIENNNKYYKPLFKHIDMITNNKYNIIIKEAKKSIDEYIDEKELKNLKYIIIPAMKYDLSILKILFDSVKKGELNIKKVDKEEFFSIMRQYAN